MNVALNELMNSINIMSHEERYYWKDTQIRRNGKPPEGFCVILPL